MGLLTCAQCGCAITAERKKGKYVYYHCTDFRGACEKTYIREERLGELLGEAIKPIQVTSEIADDIADALRSTDQDAERHRTNALRQLEQRRRAIETTMDRGYDDFVEGRISQEFWDRKSKTWEAELQVIDSERTRLQRPRPEMAVTAQKIRKTGRKSL